MEEVKVYYKRDGHELIIKNIENGYFCRILNVKILNVLIFRRTNPIFNNTDNLKFLAQMENIDGLYSLNQFEDMMNFWGNDIFDNILLPSCGFDLPVNDDKINWQEYMEIEDKYRIFWIHLFSLCLIGRLWYRSEKYPVVSFFESHEVGYANFLDNYSEILTFMKSLGSEEKCFCDLLESYGRVMEVE
jgi:hypothetical protein